MAKLTPQQSAKKWMDNYSASGQSFETAITNLKKNPIELALKKQDKMINRWLAAVRDGKWKRKLQAWNFEDWKKITIAKTKARMADGAAMGKKKMERHMTEWLPYMDQLQADLERMPDETAADRKARMNYAFDFNSKFNKEAGGGGMGLAP